MRNSLGNEKIDYLLKKYNNEDNTETFLNSNFISL